MTDLIHEALCSASKEELIDIIMERVYADPVFRRIMEYRLLQKNRSPLEQIEAFKSQVGEEMSMRHPDTTVLRSACFDLSRAMISWNVHDVLLADIAIMKAFDDALCNGAGIEDETDYELCMDIEDALDNAVKKIGESRLDAKEKEKILLLAESELKEPLQFSGEDIFAEIAGALKKQTGGYDNKRS